MLDKATIKNLGVLVDSVINEGEDTYGYVLLVFPFNESLGSQMDYISNAREDNLHDILRTAADNVEDADDFSNKEVFEDVDNH